MGAVELRGDAAQCLGAGLAVGVARVEVVQLDSEGFATAEVIDERVVGLIGLCRIGGSEVDEVGAVRYNGGGW